MSEKNTFRQGLIEAASSKPIRKFIQYDVFQHVTPGDPIVDPDQDGDCLMEGKTYELRNTGILRVYVPAGSDPVDIIRGLNKVITWIKSEPGNVVEYWGYDETEQYNERQVIEPVRGNEFESREDNPIKAPTEIDQQAKQAQAIERQLTRERTNLLALLETIDKARGSGDIQQLERANGSINDYKRDDYIPF